MLLEGNPQIKVRSIPNYEPLKYDDLMQWKKNISIPYLNNGGYWGYPDDYHFLIYSQREVSEDDQKYDMMPGFRFTWNYNKQVAPDVIDKHLGTSTWESYFVRFTMHKLFQGCHHTIVLNPHNTSD